MSEQRNNSGTLRVNKDKKTDKHRDYNGKCTVEGKEYYISAWKHSKDGQSWLSMEFTLKTDDPPF